MISLSTYYYHIFLHHIDFTQNTFKTLYIPKLA